MHDGAGGPLTNHTLSSIHRPDQPHRTDRCNAADAAVLRFDALALTVLRRDHHVVLFPDEGAPLPGTVIRAAAARTTIVLDDGRSVELPPPDPCADCGGIGCDLETGAECGTCLGAWTAGPSRRAA